MSTKPDQAQRPMDVRQLAMPLTPIAVGLFLFVFLPSPVSAQSGAPRYSASLPDQISSEAEARDNGCIFGHVEGPSVDTCLLSGYAQRQIDIRIYEKSGNSYTAGHHLVITSWYWGAKVSLRNVGGTDWILVDTEGMHGTGIAQRILLLIVWDGRTFNTVATEPLGYRCSRPTSVADYVLDAGSDFGAQNGVPILRLDYELRKGNQSVGSWTDTLHWDAAKTKFDVPQSKPDSTATVAAIRQRLNGVRSFFTDHRLSLTSPTAEEDQMAMLGDSGLLDVLSPACNGLPTSGTGGFTTEWKYWVISTPDILGAFQGNAPGFRPATPAGVAMPRVGNQGDSVGEFEAIVGLDGRTTFEHEVKTVGGMDIPEVRRVVSGWRFSPATLDGKPIRVRIRIQVANREHK